MNFLILIILITTTSKSCQGTLSLLKISEFRSSSAIFVQRYTDALLPSLVRKLLVKSNPQSYKPFEEDERIYRRRQRIKDHERAQNHCLKVCNKRATTKTVSSIILREAEPVSALVSLQHSINAEGKAFAIYICNPFAILVGVLPSAFIIIDTHKVKDDAGGKPSELLLHLPFEYNNRDKVIDGIVDWVSLQMKSSIEDYATHLHSLLMTDAERHATTFGKEYYTDIYIEGEDLLNTSWEVDRDVTCPTDNASTEAEHSNRHAKTEVKTENNNSAVYEDENAPWVSPKIITTPAKEQEIIWKGHLISFGLSALKAFQVDAVNAVESKMDAVVIQPTGSGKSSCYQLLALFDCSCCFTVVICPTLSLISLQLRGLQSQGIDAASIGSLSGGSNFQSSDLKVAPDLPSLLFTPEYFVTTIQPELMTVQDRVKLIVLDSVTTP